MGKNVGLCLCIMGFPGVEYVNTRSPMQVKLRATRLSFSLILTANLAFSHHRRKLNTYYNVTLSIYNAIFVQSLIFKQLLRLLFMIYLEVMFAIYLFRCLSFSFFLISFLSFLFPIFHFCSCLFFLSFYLSFFLFLLISFSKFVHYIFRLSSLSFFSLPFLLLFIFIPFFLTMCSL